MPNDTPRLNLLFLMTDHQRADSLGMIQDGQEVCPALNRLAEGATVFERAYTTCPLCVPARTALATGVPPHINGVIVNDWAGVSAAPYPPIHRLLHQAGYQVAHVGVDHIRVAPSLREQVPFAFWYSNPDYRHYLEALGLPRPDLSGYRRTCREWRTDGSMVTRAYSSAATGVFPYAAEHFLDWQFAEAACRFLGERAQTPFALFVAFWAPHPPLVVPEPYASLFRPEAIDLPKNVGRESQGQPEAVRLGVPAQLGEGLQEEDWRNAWAAHLGLVRLADAGIQRILEALQRSGHAENTVIVFTVDHGEHLGAHGLYQKMECYEEAIRVPLVTRVPGAPPRRCKGLVSHLDIAPTLLDLLGLPVPDHMVGRSLREVIFNGAPVRREAVFSAYDGNPEAGIRRRAIVGERWKYVWHPFQGADELYDLWEDTCELVNLADQPTYASEREHWRSLGLRMLGS